MSDLITVKDLEVSFKEKKKIHTVLKGVSFTLKKGEILGLAGESGCGKTTIAKAILKMVPVQSGEIVIHDKKSPQMVFQDPYGSLNPSKTISWILEEPLKLQAAREKDDPDLPRTAQERQKKVSEMLQEVGLDDSYLIHKPTELSGGQRQRICIGAALMQEPSILIADEPVSALDVTIQAQVLELMKRLHEKKDLSILFISHDLRTMYHFCDRIMVLKDGVIVEEGVPAKMYRSPKHEYTRLLLRSAGITIDHKNRGKKPV